VAILLTAFQERPMNETLEELRQRVALLESQVAQLLSKQPQLPKDWRRTLGMFSGDEDMRRITDEALRYREQDREAARNDPNYFEPDETE
jgi:cell division protein FtsB